MTAKTRTHRAPAPVVAAAMITVFLLKIISLAAYAVVLPYTLAAKGTAKIAKRLSVWVAVQRTTPKRTPKTAPVHKRPVVHHHTPTTMITHPHGRPRPVAVRRHH